MRFGCQIYEFYTKGLAELVRLETRCLCYKHIQTYTNTWTLLVQSQNSLFHARDKGWTQALEEKFMITYMRMLKTNQLETVEKRTRTSVSNAVVCLVYPQDFRHLREQFELLRVTT